MQTKLFPDLEQHTLMLADSHNIFLKLKSNGTLADISSLFKRIYQSEIEFASQELKRISDQMEYSIDLDSELQNNSEIFRANLKEIVSKVIDIIWESAASETDPKPPVEPKPGSPGKPAKNEPRQTPKSHFYQQKLQSDLGQKKSKAANQVVETDSKKTGDLAHGKSSDGDEDYATGSATQEMERTPNEGEDEARREIENLRKRHLESKFRNTFLV